MKKSFYYFVVTFLTCALWSCNDYVELAEHDDVLKRTQLAQQSFLSDSGGVSSSDIDKVIRRVKNKMTENERRSSTNSADILSSRDEYSLSAICDGNGQPVIHVANFNGNRGFVLISATKDFDPVLAYAPSGSFPMSGSIAPPLEAWKQETIFAIKQAASMPDSTKGYYQEKWNVMMCNADAPTISLSSSSTSGNLRDDIWQSQVLDWMHAGYTVHLLTETSITGNDQIDELMREYAQDGVYYLYDWRTHAAVVESTPSDGNTFNLVQSVWHQNANYNDSCPLIDGGHALVGCGPVAMGQIMRYHQYPTTFNWANMPYTQSTPTTAQFLHQIGVACQATYGIDGTSVTLDHIKTALNNYGYHATKGNHSKSTVINNLQAGRPVLMAGTIHTINNGYAGHAWVASGYDNSSCHKRYELFVMETPTIMTSAYVYETDFQYSDTYFYMNWGWGLNGGNGYYMDGHEMNTAPYAHPIYPISNRKNIYDIYSNN